MLATSGWQYVTLGTLSYLIGCGLSPASCSATTAPSRNPLCANIGGAPPPPLAWTPRGGVWGVRAALWKPRGVGSPPASLWALFSGFARAAAAHPAARGPPPSP